MLSIHPRKQVSPHRRNSRQANQRQYIKPAGHPIQYKLHSGTFSLTNQVVWCCPGVLSGVTVTHIHPVQDYWKVVKNYGRTRVDGKSYRVKQLGVRAWVRV